MRPLIAGTVATVSLLLLYTGILTFAESFTHAVEQFLSLWRWMVPLVLGFGFQVGLYWWIRQTASAASAGTTGAISSGSMAACCAHHFTDVFPFFGLAAAGAFLAQYQTLFLAIGVASNLVGIAVMLRLAQVHNLIVRRPIFQQGPWLAAAIGLVLIMFTFPWR